MISVFLCSPTKRLQDTNAAGNSYWSSTSHHTSYAVNLCVCVTSSNEMCLSQDGACLLRYMLEYLSTRFVSKLFYLFHVNQNDFMVNIYIILRLISLEKVV